MTSKADQRASSMLQIATGNVEAIETVEVDDAP